MEGLLEKKLLNTESAVSLAKLPMQIRGFGPVKKTNYDLAMIRRKELLKVLEEEYLNYLPTETLDNTSNYNTGRNLDNG
jgi:hypothetical protein